MVEQNTREPIIEIQNVYKRFPAGDTQITILNGISLTIHKGEFVSIIGPSGSGKSTLLNMMTGIDRPSSGEIRVAGRPIHTMSEGQLAAWRGEHVGIIFQFFQMLPTLSLLDNIILPMELAASRKYSPRERRARAAHLLETVGLAAQMHKLPNAVSGGEQQRAAIARALANDPPLLVGDEPTGNLDSRTSQDILRLFSQVANQGKTLVMVTHSQEMAARAPRVVEIRDGKISNDKFQIPYAALSDACHSERPEGARGISAQHRDSLRSARLGMTDEV
jgi:putative ABC transport system ATP-binding protein